MQRIMRVLRSLNLSNYLIPVAADYPAVGLHTLFDVANPSYVDSVVIEVHGPPVPVMGYFGWLACSAWTHSR